MSFFTGTLLVLLFSLGIPQVHRSEKPKWYTLLLLLCLCLGGALLAAYWLSRFYLHGTVLHADFWEYCTGTSSPYLLSTGVSSKRSALPMLLPRALYPYFGVFDALAIGSIISWGCIAFSLSLWARKISTPMAAYAAIGAMLCLGPLSLTTHTISSYPEMSLCFVLGALGTSYAIVQPKPHNIAFASIGIGLTLLADPRGLIWGLCYTGGLLLRLLLLQGWKQKLYALSLSCFLLYLSWRCGADFYVPEAIGFEEQVDFRPMITRIMGDQSPYESSFSYESRWVWGFATPLELPQTLLFLYKQTQLTLPNISISNEIKTARNIAQNYLSLSLLCLLLALWGLRKRPWNAFALLCTSAPFLAGLYGSLSMLENHSRFYLQTLPGTALLIAVAWSALGYKSHRYATKTTLSLWLLILFGIIPTYLSPQAGWQHRYSGSDATFSMLLQNYRSGEMAKKPDLRHCYRALRNLEIDGKAHNVTLYEQ